MRGCIMSAKMIIAIIIFSLFLIFTFQNLETVSMSFLMFDISMPRALLLIITFSLGLLIGIFIPFEFKFKDKS